MRRVLQVAGVFASFAFVVVGSASVVRSFDLISQPFPGMNHAVSVILRPMQAELTIQSAGRIGTEICLG